MCGIVGYIGQRPSAPILIDGLKRLEYRGYDSAGIALQNGRGIEVYKTKGKILDLEKLLSYPALSHSTIGLGHTRWATHGAPSSINAHPHCAGGIAVVHNGIIENYHELKSLLSAEGHVFTSDTDTEVIPNLIQSQMKKYGLDIRQAVQECARLLRGSYAVGIICDAHPDTLFAIRKGSPLIVGVNGGDHFFASDIPALLPHTNRFVYLEDGQMCVMTRDSFELVDLKSGSTLPRDGRFVTVEWSPQTAEKGGYDHFMIKEIHEQPRAVIDTLREWVHEPQRLLDELGFTSRLTVGLRSGLRRLRIVACGTSFHAALVGRYLIETIAHIPVNVEIASEFRYKDQLIEKDSLFISITQSGETADLLAAQREARNRGAWTTTICNVVGSSATREADAVLYTQAGPEIGVASTKTFTAQIAALVLLAVTLGLGLRKEEKKALLSQLLAVPDLMARVLSRDGEIKELATKLLNAKNCLFLGRGISYPIALEGALKLKEISYVHAEGYPAGEMKHGPIALVEGGLPVIVIVPMDGLFEKTISNIEEVKARGARVIAITDEPGFLREKVDVNEVIETPTTHPAFSPFLSVLPLQLLAYYTGVLKGCNVDQPRNLAKSVTVE